MIDPILGKQTTRDIYTEFMSLHMTLPIHSLLLGTVILTTGTYLAVADSCMDVWVAILGNTWYSSLSAIFKPRKMLHRTVSLHFLLTKGFLSCDWSLQQI